MHSSLLLLAVTLASSAFAAVDTSLRGQSLTIPNRFAIDTEKLSFAPGQLKQGCVPQRRLT
jgi:hypothetical protein